MEGCSSQGVVQVEGDKSLPYCRSSLSTGRFRKGTNRHMQEAQRRMQSSTASWTDLPYLIMLGRILRMNMKIQNVITENKILLYREREMRDFYVTFLEDDTHPPCSAVLCRIISVGHVIVSRHEHVPITTVTFQDGFVEVQPYPSIF